MFKIQDLMKGLLLKLQGEIGFGDIIYCGEERN